MLRSALYGEIENALQKNDPAPHLADLTGKTDVAEALATAIEAGVPVSDPHRRRAYRHLFRLEETTQALPLSDRQASAGVCLADSEQRPEAFDRSTVSRRKDEIVGDLVLGALSAAIESRFDQSLHVIPGSDNSSLNKFIRDESPQHIRFLEFTADSVKDSIRYAIQESSCKQIDLLVASPTCISTYHRDRMVPAIENIVFALRDAPDPPRTTVRCYRRAPSLRGRHCGDLLVTGWYTHEARAGDQQRANRVADREVLWGEVWGHDNPAIAIRRGHPGFEALSKQFDRVFDFLWLRGDGRAPLSLLTESQICGDERFVENRWAGVFEE